MFVKLYTTAESFQIFRTEDVISIDPVYANGLTVSNYKLRLLNHQQDIDLLPCQAHDLSVQLQSLNVFCPAQYE